MFFESELFRRWKVFRFSNKNVNVDILTYSSFCGSSTETFRHLFTPKSKSLPCLDILNLIFIPFSCTSQIYTEFHKIGNFTYSAISEQRECLYIPAVSVRRRHIFGNT